MLLAALLALVPTMPALAALGADVSSVQADARHFHASVRLAHHEAGWTVQEMQGTGSTVIREFVGSDGTVFAVSWSGPGNPDLRQLLGNDHFTRLRAGAATGHRLGHGHARLETDDMVYEVQGRMPHLEGRAWLPARLPAGFSTDQIN